MKITEALIERFFKNDCDETEQQAVKNYFSRHPEVLKKYMTERSWLAFETDEAVPEPVSEKMLDTIRQQTYGRRRTILIRRWWAAAAAVLVLAVGTYWYSHTGPSRPEKMMVAEKTIAALKQEDSFYTASNTTGKPLTLTLEDSTRVELAPLSTLTYAVPFRKDRRDLTLKGQAVFYVSKDPSKPFTVYAGRLATTAIGTVFRITAFDGRPTSVHLLSGKVRVEADSGIAPAERNAVYLLPGQELQLNEAQHLVLLNRKNKAPKPSLATTRPAGSQPDSTVMVFHNESLEQLFTAVSEKYLTKIVFRPEQVSGMSFTGKYDHRNETLAGFIQTICLLNNLTMRKEDSIIIIEGQ